MLRQSEHLGEGPVAMQRQGDSNSSPGQRAAEDEAMGSKRQKQTQSSCVHALPSCVMLGDLVPRSQHLKYRLGRVKASAHGSPPAP